MSERNKPAANEGTEAENEAQPAQTEEPQHEYGPGEGPAFSQPEAQTEEALPNARKGERVVIYTGRADVLRHGEHTFRPGQPVVVPSEVAEELLTLPFESFIDAHEAQKAKE